MVPNGLRPRRSVSTRLTLSTNWAQSNDEMRRMLVITFRTVTFMVACRWCSRRTTSSAVVPWAPPTTPAEAEKAVGEFVRHLPRRAAADDPFGEAAQVLDQEDPKADRDRPQLADRQRLHPLVGPHHAPQALRFDAAVR